MLKLNQIWQAYIDTEIIQKSNDVAWTGQDAIPLPWLPPIHIITACNPFEQVLTDDENQKRNSALEEILNARNLKYESVIAKSTKGSWQEISFAIHGLSRVQACELASQFEQRAIFEIDNEELHVITAKDMVLQKTKKRIV